MKKLLNKLIIVFVVILLFSSCVTFSVLYDSSNGFLYDKIDEINTYYSDKNDIVIIHIKGKLAKIKNRKGHYSCYLKIHDALNEIKKPISFTPDKPAPAPICKESAFVLTLDKKLSLKTGINTIVHDTISGLIMYVDRKAIKKGKPELEQYSDIVKISEKKHSTYAIFTELSTFNLYAKKHNTEFKKVNIYLKSVERRTKYELLPLTVIIDVITLPLQLIYALIFEMEF